MRLQVRSLSLAYREVVALQDVSADVDGRVIGVLGATASGKTSLLRILVGQIPPTAGEALIDGQVVLPLKRRDIAFVPRRRAPFRISSGRGRR